MNFRLDHIGIAVPEMRPALEQYTALLGYRLLRGPYDDPLQQATVAFIGLGDDDPAPLELVAPLAPGSQVERVLAKGLGLYHLCYETPDVAAAVAHLRGQKCILISGPTPAVAYDGRPIAWLYTSSRQLIELVEAPAGNKSA